MFIFLQLLVSLYHREAALVGALPMMCMKISAICKLPEGLVKCMAFTATNPTLAN